MADLDSQRQGREKRKRCEVALISAGGTPAAMRRMGRASRLLGWLGSIYVALEDAWFDRPDWLLRRRTRQKGSM